MPRGVSQWFTARFDALDGEPVPTRLTYRQDRPWEVAVRFGDDHDNQAATVWIVGRELLTAGLQAAAGIGDVRVSPAGPIHLRLELHNGETGVSVYLRYPAVAGFLRATARLVPHGTESRHLDLETVCDALMRRAA